MNQDLYDAVKVYLKTGNTPPGSRFADYRFKKHFSPGRGWSIDTGILTFMGRKIIPESELAETLQSIYNNPLISRNGFYTFYKKVCDMYAGITFRQCRTFLENCETYQLHRQTVKGYQTKPIIKSTPRTYLQADTVDLSDLGWANNNWTHLLTIIDVFSKYAFVFPMKANSSSETARNIKLLLSDYPRNPNTHKPDLETIHTDNGSEFQGEFKTLLESRGIRIVHSRSHNPNGQAHVERFNRTLKTMIYQYLTKFNTKVYIPVLDSIVSNYNNSFHSTIKAKPVDIWNSNSRDVIEKTKSLIVDKVSGKMNLRARAIPTNIVPGAHVRVLLTAIDANKRKAQNSGIGKDAKKYIKLWTDNIYTVKSRYMDRDGRVIIKLREEPWRLYIHECQYVDPGELITNDQTKADLRSYGIDVSGFGRSS